MKKTLLVVPYFLGLSCLFSCTPHTESSIRDDTSVKLKRILFDGNYVQTYNFTWPIAFNSYKVEDIYLIIDGNFIIGDKNLINEELNYLEEFLNSDSLPYVISAHDNSPYFNDCFYSNMDNTAWDLINIDEDDSVSFNVMIDISPIVSKDKELGELLLFGEFYVFHTFELKEVVND